MNPKTLKLVLAVCCGVAMLAVQVPAYAQGLMPGFQLNKEKELTPEEKERNEANERAARDAQKSIKAPKVSNDPWGDVRAAETPAAKPAKSKKVH